MHPKIRFFFTTLLHIYCSLSYALPSDIEKPIRIEADSAERDEPNGRTIYQGDVKITQGTLIISAEKIIILDTTEQLDRINATGTPATLSQQVTKEGERVYASANSIEYIVSQKKIELSEQAQLIQGGSKISSEKINYSVIGQVINAKGSGQGSRVEMVIPAKVTNQETTTEGAK
jgi:lipopolysaccharide export system protein LptA